MKYAIYDKAADGYLTKLEFENDVPVQTLGLICGYNEYITEAKLLDTKEEAVAVVTRIESNKFMEKGRFVIHSFDDTLNDQYIISEAGNPTKVVDNITVDLDGTINVKYGTMMSHWSATSLEYAINRMNALQKAKSPKYTAWCNTFDIYKVITVMDERTNTHSQFINVTAKGLEEYAKDEEEKLLVAGNEIINTTSLLNKRIEELELANYNLGEMKTLVEGCANRLQKENDDLKTKVESIKKEARDWKNLYENASDEREELKNTIDIIHMDLVSPTACDDLKDTLKAINCNSGLDRISMGNFLTAKDEIHSIVYKMIRIIESRELNQSVAFSAAEEIPKTIAKAQKAEKALDDQNKLNDANKATIAQMVVEKRDMNKEIKELRTMRDCLASIMHAIRNAICDNNSAAFDCIESRIIHDSDFNSSPFMAGVRENIEDICDVEKRNIVKYAFKCRELARSSKELSDAADALNEVNDKNEELTNILKEITSYVADIMLATRTTDHDKMISDLMDVSLKMGVKTMDDGPMYGISVILAMLIRFLKEKCETLELNEKYKNRLNSMYGYCDTDDAAINYCMHDIIITGRCCGKQLMADILSEKKIPISKDKYDSILTSLKLIDLSYEGVYGTNICILPKPKPTWLPGLLTEFNDLTK